MTAHAPIQTYASNHMIAELAEPRISANVRRPFPPFGVPDLGARLSRCMLILRHLDVIVGVYGALTTGCV